MKTFYLYERPDGRIVLNPNEEPDSKLIREIKADTWKLARESIGEDEFFHVPGEGYFESPTPRQWGVAKAYRARQEKERARVALVLASFDEGKRTGRPNAPGKHKRGRATDELFA